MVHAEDVLINLKEVSVYALKNEPIHVLFYPLKNASVHSQSAESAAPLVQRVDGVDSIPRVQSHRVLQRM